MSPTRPASRARLSTLLALIVLLVGCGSSNLPAQDLAPWFVAASSSTSESRYLTGEFAFDGDLKSRWASAFQDNQVLIGTLAVPAAIDRIELTWESACATDYDVALSEDGTTWTTVAARRGAPGGLDTITLPNPILARHVRVHAIKRKTEWGNSIFEVRLHGAPTGPAPARSLAGFEAPPTEWDKRCREIRDRLMAQAAADPKTSAGMTDDQFLELVSRRAFDFFWYETNPENGLTIDQTENFRSSERHRTASIASVGYALSAYVIGANRGWVTRDEARERILVTLKFLAGGGTPHNRGFFYHFLDLFTGKPDEGTELSSIDSALFLSGLITAVEEFRSDSEIATIGDELIERVDWKWMLNGHPHFPAHGVGANGQFLNSRWGSTTEGMLCYILGIGAPTHAMPAEAWKAYDRHSEEYKGYRLVVEYGGQSIFRFQYPCLWYDFRNRHDGVMDYFENGIEATLAMRQYCLDLSPSFPRSYGPSLWGLGAANGPQDIYRIYGFPPGRPEYAADGTVVVYAIAGSLPFVPELAIPALRYLYDHHHESWGKYGFTDAVNPQLGIVTERVIGLDQGTMLIAIENYRSGLVWDRFMRSRVAKKFSAAVGWTMKPDPNAPHAPVNLAGSWQLATSDAVQNVTAEGSIPGARTVIAPDRWDNQDTALGTWDGVATYARAFTVEDTRLAAWRGAPLVFHAGGIDDIDEVFVNGQSIGSTTASDAWNKERVYAVPSGLLKPGRNIITVRVKDSGGYGGLWRRPLRIGPHIPAEFQPIRR